MKIPNGFSYAGFNDWRVPTIQELKSLVYCSSGEPKIWNATGASCKSSVEPAFKSEVFINTPVTWFWSSSPASSSNNAWVVYFGNGTANDYPKNFGYVVRLVRGIQNSDNNKQNNIGDNSQPPVVTPIVEDKTQDAKALDCNVMDNYSVLHPVLDAVEGYENLALDLYREEKIDDFINNLDVKCSYKQCLDNKNLNGCTKELAQRKEKIKKYKEKLYSTSTNYNLLSNCETEAQQLTASFTTSEEKERVKSLEASYKLCIKLSLMLNKSLMAK
jgi:hypothetical protein